MRVQSLASILLALFLPTVYAAPQGSFYHGPFTFDSTDYNFYTSYLPKSTTTAAASSTTPVSSIVSSVVSSIVSSVVSSVVSTTSVKTTVVTTVETTSATSVETSSSSTPSPTPSPTPTPTSLVTSTVRSSTPVSTPSSTIVTTSAASLPSGYLEIVVHNAWDKNLALSIVSNAGSPTLSGSPAESASLAMSATSTFLAPTGWAGAIQIGPIFNSQNTRIEGSFISGIEDMDISHVNGYSAPATCFCDNGFGGNSTVPTGCNLDLWTLGNTCQNPFDSSEDVCDNPQQFVDNGPALPFFQPCQGAAYTYPNDNAANMYDNCPSNRVICCIGTDACPGNPAQASQP